MILNTSKIKLPGLWDEIRAYEGKKFLTKKGLPFTYSIKGESCSRIGGNAPSPEAPLRRRMKSCVWIRRGRLP